MGERERSGKPNGVNGRPTDESLKALLDGTLLCLFLSFGFCFVRSVARVFVFAFAYLS